MAARPAAGARGLAGRGNLGPGHPPGQRPGLHLPVAGERVPQPGQELVRRAGQRAVGHLPGDAARLLDLGRGGGADRVALHSSATLRTAIYPLLIGSQAVPIVVIAPILAIIFGYSMLPKLIVVAITCFFPIVVSLVDGLSSVDPDLIKVMRTLDGGRLATLWRVEAPGALPSFFSGLRIAAVYAPIGAVFGEFAGSQNGLGYVLIQATPQLATDLVFA